MPRWDVGEQPVAGYKLIDFLGRGGFGEVWLAEAPGGIQCALKIIDLVSPDALKELKALRIMKRLRHPHLVPVTAFWVRDRRGNVLNLDDIDLSKPTSQLSELLIAMGLGDKSLAKRLEEENPLGTLPENRIGIPADELMRYMEGVAKGIDYLNQPDHRLGEGDSSIIHCDIKPGNLLVVSDEAQVCDYGLARALKRDERRVSMAGGTPAYSPPELLGNKPCLGTDQYSLAISYCELRTGSLPFPEEMSLTDIYRIHAEERLDFTHPIFTSRERDVLRRATRSRPTDRFSNCRKFTDELKAAVFRAPTGTISMSSLDRTAEMPALKPNIAPTPEPQSAPAPIPTRQETPRGTFLAELREGGHPIPGYTLAHLLSTDSTGQTWQATDSMDRLRVLRIIFQPATKDPAGLAGLNALLGLEHDHIARLYDYAFVANSGEVINPELVGKGPTAAGLVLVTEDVVRTMADRLSECQNQEGRLGIPEEELIRYIREAGLALDAMREKATSLLHLRLRPDVVGLTRHGSVKIIDAGLAPFVPIGEMKAAIAAAAPEVIEGQPSGRSDAYALALTYTKLRAGRYPFHETLDISRQRELKKRAEFEWVLVSGPEQECLTRATRPNPGERYPSVKSFVESLAESLAPKTQPAYRSETLAPVYEQHQVDFNTPPDVTEEPVPLRRSETIPTPPNRRETPRPSQTYDTPRKSEPKYPPRQGSLVYGADPLDEVEPPPSVLPAAPAPVAPWEKGSSATHKPLPASKVNTPRSFLQPSPQPLTKPGGNKKPLIIAGVIGSFVVGGGLIAFALSQGGGGGNGETTPTSDVAKVTPPTEEKKTDAVALAEKDILALEEKQQFSLAVARAEKETATNEAWVRLRINGIQAKWRGYISGLPEDKQELALAEYAGKFDKDEWLLPRRQKLNERKLVLPDITALSLKDGLEKLSTATKDLETLKPDVSPEAWTAFVTKADSAKADHRKRVFVKAKVAVLAKLAEFKDAKAELAEAREADENLAKRLQDYATAAAAATDAQTKTDAVRQSLLPLIKDEAGDDKDLIANIMVKAGNTHPTERKMIREALEKLPVGEKVKTEVARWASSAAMEKLTGVMAAFDSATTTAIANTDGTTLAKLREAMEGLTKQLAETKPDAKVLADVQLKLKAMGTWAESRESKATAAAVANAFAKELPDPYKLALLKEVIRRGVSVDGPTVADVRSMRSQLVEADIKATDVDFQSLLAKVLWDELKAETVNWTAVEKLVGSDDALGFGPATTAEHIYESNKGILTDEAKVKFQEALVKATAKITDANKDKEYGEYVNYLVWLKQLGTNPLDTSAGAGYTMTVAKKVPALWTTSRKAQVAKVLREASLPKFKKPEWISDKVCDDAEKCSLWLSQAWALDSKTDDSVPAWLALAHASNGKTIEAKTAASLFTTPLSRLAIPFEYKVKFGLIKLAETSGREKDNLKAELAWDAVEWLHVAMNREQGNNWELKKSKYDKYKKELNEEYGLFAGEELAVKAAVARLDILNENNDGLLERYRAAKKVLVKAANSATGKDKANYLAWAAVVDITDIFLLYDGSKGEFRNKSDLKDPWLSLCNSITEGRKADPENGEIHRVLCFARYLTLLPGVQSFYQPIREVARDTKTWPWRDGADDDYGTNFRIAYVKDARKALELLSYRNDPDFWGMRAEIGFYEWVLFANTQDISVVRASLKDAESAAMEALKQKHSDASKYQNLLGNIREDIAWITPQSLAESRKTFEDSIQAIENAVKLAKEKDPNKPSNELIRYTVDLGRVKYLNAVFARNSNKALLDSAIDTLRTAQTIAVANAQKSESAYFLGLALIARGDHDAALKALEAVSEDSAYWKRSDLAKGLSLLAKADKTEILNKWKDKTGPTAVYLLGKATRSSDRDKAKDILQKVMSYDLFDPATPLALKEYIECKPTDAIKAAKLAVDAVERYPWLILPQDRRDILETARTVADATLKARITTLEKKYEGY